MKTVWKFVASTLIGGLLVQLVLSAARKEALVDRTTVNDVTGLALDLLVAAARVNERRERVLLVVHAVERDAV